MFIEYIYIYIYIEREREREREMRKIKYNILDYSIEFIHPIVLNLNFFFF